MDRTDVSPPSLRNGWLIGSVIACAVMAGFLVYFRDLDDPLMELMLVYAPIGATIGALVGIAVDPRSLPTKRRLGMSLSVIAGFASYSIGLILYLLSHA